MHAWDAASAQLITVTRRIEALQMRHAALSAIVPLVSEDRRLTQMEPIVC